MARTVRPKPGAGKVKEAQGRPVDVERELYRMLFKEAANGIFVLDRQGRFIDVNPRGCRMAGYSRREFLALHYHDLVPAEDVAETSRRIEGELRAGKTYTGRARLKCKNGKLLPVEIIAHMLSDGRLLGVARDIRAHKADEEKIGALARFPSENPHPVMRVGFDRKIQYANAASQPLLDEWKTGVGKSMPRAWKTFLDERAREGSRATVEVACGERVFSVLFVPIPDNNYINLYGMDLTDRRRAEEALNRQAREWLSIQTIVFEITAPHQLSDLLYTIVERAANLLEADTGGMYLCDPERQEVRCVVSYNTPRDYRGVTLKYGEGAAGLVAQTEEPLLIDDYHSWSGQAAVFSQEKPFERLISVPMRWQGQVIGVIHVLRSKRDAPFTTGDLDLLSLFANHAAIAAANSQQMDHLQAELAERKRVEQALRDNEKRFRELFDHMSNSVAIYEAVEAGRDFIFKDFNRAGEKTENIKREQLIGRSVQEVFSGVKEFGLLEVFQRVWKTGKSERHPISLYRDKRLAGWRENYVCKLPNGEIVAIYEDVTEKKRAEESLRESEERYRNLFNRVPVALYRSTQDGRILDANPALLEMLGYPDIGSLLDVNAADHFVNPAEREQMKLLLARDGELRGFETQYRRRDGKLFWARDHIRIVQNEAEQAVYEGALEDITEQRQADVALRASEARYRLLFDNAPLGILLVNSNGQILEVNAAALQILGSPSAEATRGINVLYFPPLVEAGFSADLERCFKQGLAIENDYRYTSVWGKSVEARVHYVPLPGESGSVDQVQIIVEDTTERNQAVNALRKSASDLRRAQSIAHLGSWNLDLTRNILTWSDETYRIFGIPSGKALTFEDFLAYVHPDDLEFVNQSWQAALRGDPFNIEHRILVDGRVKWVRERAEFESDADGRIRFGVGTVQDITARKLHERELEAEAMFAQAMSKTGGIQPLLDQLLEATRYAIPGAEKGTLALLVDHEHLQVRAASGYRENDVLGFTYPITWGYAGRAFRREQPSLITDVREDPELQAGIAGATLEEVRELRSAIVVPLLVQESIIGVISLESANPNVFGEEDLRLLANFAVPAALIIERTRLFEETSRRARETAALLNTSLSLNTLDLQDTLQTIGEHAKTLFNADGCRIFLLEPDGRSMRCVLALLENPKAFSDLVIAIGEGVTGAVAASGQAEIVNDMLHDPRTILVPGTEEEPEAIMFAPLKEQNRVIGVISIRRVGTQRPFRPNDLDLLKAFASMAASTVSSAHLFDETRQRVAALEMLHESGLALNQLLTPEEIGKELVELLEQKMGWHHTTIRLYHPEKETLELLAFNQPGMTTQEERREVERRFISHVARPGEGLSGWVVQNSSIVRSGNVGSDPRFADTYPGLNSGMYVPMKSGPRVIGVISIESEQPDAFSEADERLVATLANQAASALENARLFHETRQRVTELETVNRISIALRAITKQEEMLAVVLEETLDALNAAHGAISLLDETTGKLHKVEARGWLSKFTESPIEPGESIFGKVFTDGNAHVSHEFASDPLTHPEARGKLRPGWGGASVPIRSSAQTLGIMIISIPSGRELSQDEVRLINTLAEMTGNALHRMRLYEETVHRAEVFSSLYEMNTAISAEYDLKTLLQTIVNNSASLLGSKGGGMYLYDPIQQEMEVVVAANPTIPIGTRLKVGEGIAGHVAETRQPVRIDDYAAWHNRSSQYDTITVRAVLEVPILFGGELIGVLVAHEIGDSNRKYTEADERLLSLFAAQAAGIIHSTRLREETQRRLQNLQALHEVDQVITSSFDLRPILGTVINHTITQLNVDAADILLLNPILQTLEYAAGFGFYTRNVERTRHRLGEGHSGRAALERRTIHIPNLPETGVGFMRASLLADEKFLEYFGVPLISKGEIKGVLEVFHRSPLYPGQEWMEVLETLAGQAAIAIDNSQLFEHIQRSNMELSLAYEATIEGWSRAMDLRDEETEGHTQRVTERTVTLARAMGMQEEEILHLRRGALLHDIGKIGVPDRILLKPASLTDEEREIMRQHPKFAYEMLYPILYLRQSLEIPYLHHEKWDGTGYPQGLKGEQIPLAARIFAVLDVYDALTSDRPYRKAWPKTEALDYIRQQSGRHFDPHIVDKFMLLFGSEMG